MIYAVIPVHNRINKTLSCVRSLYSQKRDDLLICVVDDGSTDSTETILNTTFPDIEVLKGDGNLYWTGSVQLAISNILLAANSSDYVLLVNNDVEVIEGTIDRLINFSESKGRRVLVNALSVNREDKTTIVKSGTRVVSWIFNITQHIHHNRKIDSIDCKQAVEADLLTGRCLLHPVEVFREIGNYNAAVFPHYGGDDEFTCRAKRAGYGLYVLPMAPVLLDTSTSGDESTLWKGGFSAIWARLFGIRSNINLMNKYRIAKHCAPAYAMPTYFLVGIIKSLGKLVFR